jgi:GT2 family glycosyltransferase
VAAPELTVVVPSHDRPLRLRWLLNALEEQTLTRDAWEVVVCHDSAAETEALLREHPLATSGTLRHLRIDRRGGSGASRKRNLAWRAARGRFVIFTDDDCRPPPEWAERALAVARAHPDAIVQGATTPDPDEAPKLRASGAKTQNILPPTPWAQTCNILYPRAVLEAMGGLDERFDSGEDTDLAERARAAGSPFLPAPEVETHHAIEVLSTAGRLRLVPRWRHLPAVIARYPHLRRTFPLLIFWKAQHLGLLAALFGLSQARRRPLALLLTLPYAGLAGPYYGPGLRGRIRALTELPSAALVDVAEIAALAVGSVEARTLLL